MADSSDPFMQSNPFYDHVELDTYDPFAQAKKTTETATPPKTMPRMVKEAPKIPAPATQKPRPAETKASKIPVAPEAPVADFEAPYGGNPGDREKELQKREANLAARERALEQREKSLGGGNGKSLSDAPNFPPFLPFIHHDLLHDFDNWFHRIVLISAIGVQVAVLLATFANMVILIWAGIIAIFYTVHTVFYNYIFHMLLGVVLHIVVTPALFILQYKPLYSALRYGRGTFLIYSAAISIVLQLLCLVACLGLVTTGTALLYDFWDCTTVFWPNLVMTVVWWTLSCCFLAQAILVAVVFVHHYKVIPIIQRLWKSPVARTAAKTATKQAASSLKSSKPQRNTV
ncbi:secretory carrier-associated membrane protein [Carpediemonas membranifera]|uniref:Secretory carrier-associated membrane protein n=1 Tax=Carpediemonas membranifera TaxID=201153 RepID=A0A8J6AXL1_9EUKA|nr:secretory carrier-associated membrane protein [Carpediemonas membranifera]|eukprot:KAG9397336.1 secretory carrier-associated membrane protein [Carpediemonas membranifera]